MNYIISDIDTTSVTSPDTSTIAVFNLVGDSVNCSQTTIDGAYFKGQVLTSSNTVSFKVDVSAAGKYVVTTDTINGINFFGNGVFTNTGIQYIKASGNGTPQDSGIYSFKVKANNNICNFNLHIDSAAVGDTSVSTSDYFPVSANSYWVYQDNSGANPPSPLTITCTGAKTTFAGKTYNLFVNTVGDTNYYRKENGLYYEYGSLGYFTSGYIDNPPIIEYVFLKDEPQGTTWETPEYDVTNNGVPVKAKMSFEITYRAPVSIMGISTDIIDVLTKVLQKDPVLGWQEVQSYDSDFAKDIGLTEFADPRKIIRWGGLLDYKVY